MKNKAISNRIKMFYENNSTCIISMIIVGIFMLLFMIILGIVPFGIKSFVAGDAYQQVLPLLSVLQDKLKNGDSIMYYWNSGLGGDFLPSYFYYLASPSNLLVYFFDRNDISAFISIMIALKIILSAGFFGYYISRKNGIVENKPIYVALSCAYALSGFICNYYLFTFWLDSIMVFPLIMLGYNKLINEKKPGLYTVSLAYSLYCNYYISYIICLFLLIWFLIDEFKNIKEFIKKGLLFALYSVLSAGLSAVALIPSFIGLTKTASMGENAWVTHQWYGNIFSIIRQMFIFSMPHRITYVENIAYIYCGTFVFLLFFTYGFIKDIKLSKRIKIICFLFVLFISMNESILNFIWHGFHVQHSVPNRFAFLFIFLLLHVSSECFDHIKNNENKVIIGLIPAMILPVLSFVFMEFDSLVSSYEIILISEILLVIYAVLMIVHSQKTGIAEKISGIVLSIIMIIEICFNAFLLLSFELNNNYNIAHNVEHIDEAFIIEDADPFYRSDINEGILYNENAYHGMNGVGAFNSTLYGSVPLFMNYMGSHVGANCVLNYQMSDLLNDILSVKYIYTYDGDTCYDDNNNYEMIYNDEIFSLYKNKRSLSLGFAVNNLIKDYSYQDYNIVSKNINMLTSSMVRDTAIISEIIPEYKINYSGCELGIGDTDYLSMEYSETGEPKDITISFIPQNDGLYYFDLRESNEDLITLKINDKNVRDSIRMINGLCRIGYITPEDEVKISISDNPGYAFQKNDDISEVKLFVYKIDEEVLDSFIETLSKHQMSVSDFKDNKFDAEVSLETNQLLFTSIPYDKGWHVYENGKELKTLVLAGTFLGLDPGEGNHSLSFRFVPEGLYLGIMVSVISWVIFLSIIIVFHNKEKA